MQTDAEGYGCVKARPSLFDEVARVAEKLIFHCLPKGAVPPILPLFAVKTFRCELTSQISCVWVVPVTSLFEKVEEAFP